MASTVAPLTVAVTGAAGPVGAGVVAALAAGPTPLKVIAIDVGRRSVPGATWRTGDVRDAALGRKLAGVDAVVHAALDLSPDAPSDARRTLHVDGTRTLIDAAAHAGVRRVVVITSAMVYGASPDNPVPLPEDSPLRAERDGLVGDLLQIEEIVEAARMRYPGIAITVIRPAALVGPGIDTLMTRHFAAPRILTVKGAPMRWQFCHVDDLGSAAAMVMATPGQTMPAAVTCGSDGWLTPYDVSTMSGLRRVELPPAVAFGAADRLHRSGLVPSPASELAFVAYPWVIDSDALRSRGWSPAHDNGQAFEALLESLGPDRALAGRRIGVRDATIAGAGASATVAGATVALIGAAAFVRRARRARR